MKRLAVFLWFFVAGASLCHAQAPQAEMLLNGASFARGDFFSATFQLNSSITQPFTVYAVVITPHGSMLNALTLGPKVKPVASNVPRLDPPFSYPIISLNLPSGAPLGQYEVVAVFFDPSKPITGRQAAFLDVSGKFEIAGDNPPTPAITPTPTKTPALDWYLKYGPSGSGDVVKIGTMYVASKKDGTGCANGDTKKWQDAIDWANGLSWLDKDDWRMPAKDELSAICAVKDTTSGFTYRSLGYYWSSTEPGASDAWAFYFGNCNVYKSGKTSPYYVRAVRGVE
ncbi:MAG: DUF1566 domain-containing protein [Candidatus Aureabacteria bacterium]|nr:DUF1566 domain-containing protein [Candidatus Auribacterota bacterium]